MIDVNIHIIGYYVNGDIKILREKITISNVYIVSVRQVAMIFVLDNLSKYIYRSVICNITNNNYFIRAPKQFTLRSLLKFLESEKNYFGTYSLLKSSDESLGNIIKGKYNILQILNYDNYNRISN